MCVIIKYMIIVLSITLFLSGCSGGGTIEVPISRIEYTENKVEMITAEGTYLEFIMKYNGEKIAAPNYRYINNKSMRPTRHSFYLRNFVKKIKNKKNIPPAICLEIIDKKTNRSALINNSKCLSNPVLNNRLTQISSLQNIDIYLNKIKETNKNKNIYVKYFSNKDKKCHIPNITPIDYNFCNNPEAIEKARLSCLKPLGRKACSVLANKQIKKENLTTNQKAAAQFLSSQSCSLLINKGLSGTAIADDLGDSMRESDSLLANLFGYVLETGAALSMAAKVNSCYSNLTYKCDAQVRVKHKIDAKNCLSEQKIFNASKDNNLKLKHRYQIALNKAKNDLQVSQSNYTRKSIVRNLRLTFDETQ